MLLLLDLEEANTVQHASVHPVIRVAQETFSILGWRWALLSCSLPFQLSTTYLVLSAWLYSPSSPLFQISFGQMLCLLSPTLSFAGWWLPENKTKILPCFYKYFSLLKSKKTYILRSYLCVVHINCTALYYIMMLSCKILLFLLLHLSLYCFKSLAWKWLVRHKTLWLWWFLVAGLLNRKFHDILKPYLDEIMSCSEMELWCTVTTSRVQIHSVLVQFWGLISPYYYDIQKSPLQLTLLHALLQRFLFVVCYFLRLKISSLWFMSSFILAFFKLLCLYHFIEHSFPNGYSLTGSTQRLWAQ